MPQIQYRGFFVVVCIAIGRGPASCGRDAMIALRRASIPRANINSRAKLQGRFVQRIIVVEVLQTDIQGTVTLQSDGLATACHRRGN
jgi:hypothetical protein